MKKTSCDKKISSERLLMSHFENHKIWWIIDHILNVNMFILVEAHVQARK